MSAGAQKLGELMVCGSPGCVSSQDLSNSGARLLPGVDKGHELTYNFDMANSFCTLVMHILGTKAYLPGCNPAFACDTMWCCLHVQVVALVEQVRCICNDTVEQEDCLGCVTKLLRRICTPGLHAEGTRAWLQQQLAARPSCEGP